MTHFCRQHRTVVLACYRMAAYPDKWAYTNKIVIVQLEDIAGAVPRVEEAVKRFPIWKCFLCEGAHWRLGSPGGRNSSRRLCRASTCGSVLRRGRCPFASTAMGGRSLFLAILAASARLNTRASTNSVLDLTRVAFLLLLIFRACVLCTRPRVFFLLGVI